MSTFDTVLYGTDPTYDGVSLPQPITWWDINYSTGIVQSSGVFTSAADRSGNSRTLTVGAGTVAYSASALNGRAGITTTSSSFVKGPDGGNGLTSTGANANSFTVIMLAAAADLTSAHYQGLFTNSNSGIGTNSDFDILWNNPVNDFEAYTSEGAGSIPLGSGALSGTQLRSIMATVNGSGATLNGLATASAIAGINGAEATSTGGMAITHNMNGAWLFGVNGQNTAQWMAPGVLAELIIYPGVLTAAQRAAAVACVMWKAGLQANLVSGNAYHTTSPVASGPAITLAAGTRRVAQTVTVTETAGTYYASLTGPTLGEELPRTAVTVASTTGTASLAPLYAGAYTSSVYAAATGGSALATSGSFTMAQMTATVGNFSAGNTGVAQNITWANTTSGGTGLSLYGQMFYGAGQTTADGGRVLLTASPQAFTPTQVVTSGNGYVLKIFGSSDTTNDNVVLATSATPAAISASSTSGTISTPGSAGTTGTAIGFTGTLTGTTTGTIQLYKSGVAEGSPVAVSGATWSGSLTPLSDAVLGYAAILIPTGGGTYSSSAFTVHPVVGGTSGSFTINADAWPCITNLAVSGAFTVQCNGERNTYRLKLTAAGTLGLSATGIVANTGQEIYVEIDCNGFALTLPTNASTPIPVLWTNSGTVPTPVTTAGVINAYMFRFTGDNTRALGSPQ